MMLDISYDIWVILKLFHLSSMCRPYWQIRFVLKRLRFSLRIACTQTHQNNEELVQKWSAEYRACVTYLKSPTPTQTHTHTHAHILFSPDIRQMCFCGRLYIIIAYLEGRWFEFIFNSAVFSYFWKKATFHPPLTRAWIERALVLVHLRKM